MRASTSLLGVFLWMTAACCLQACGSDHSRLTDQPPDGAVPGPTSTPDPAGNYSLPAPSAYKDTSDLITGVFSYGNQFVCSLVHQRVVGIPTLGAQFTPDYTHTGDEPAIAMYRLDTTGYDPGSTLSLAWADPGDYAAAWIGLADYAGNRWDWRKAPAAGPIIFDPAQHLSGGTIMVAVVVTGTTERVLDYLWLGSIRPPLIVAVTPSGAKTGEATAFSSTMHPGSGTATSWSWDFGSAAIPATTTEASPTVTLQDPGVYFVTVTADNEAGTMAYRFPLAVSEAWTNWDITAITGGFEDLVATSLALEHDGGESPHMACATAENLYYFNRAGYDWAVQMYLYEASADIELTNSALALDAAGRVWLTYGKRTGYVKCFSNNHGAYEWSIVDTPGTAPPIRRLRGPRLALDSTGIPHVSYYKTIWDDDYDADAVMYSVYDGSTWSTPHAVANSGGLMDVGTIWPMVPLALDSNDNPSIAFCNDSSSELILAHRDGTWSDDVIESSHSTPEISLDIDAADHPHVAYVVSGVPTRIYYARFDGVDWSVEPLIGTANAYPAISLQLDSNDNPHIAYYNGSTKDLHMAFYDGEWYNLHVDALGDVGQACSLALDSTDRAHITYFDWSTEWVKYALEPLP